MSHGYSSNDQGPQTAGDWFLIALLLLFIVAMLTGMIFHEFQPMKLGILFVLGSWAVLLATHEAGHAVAARWLGCPVERIVLGMGWMLGTVRMGGIPVEIRLAPVEGFVQPGWSELRWPRLGRAFIYFAGPGTDLAFGLIVLLAGNVEQFGQPSEDYGIILWQSFVVAAFAQGILNLIPHSVRTSQGEIPNDGLGILRSLWMNSAQATEGQSSRNPEDDPADWRKRR